MYKVKYVIAGLLREIIIKANESNEVFTILTNMYGSGNIVIIDVKRIS